MTTSPVKDREKNEALGLPTTCPSWCTGLKGHRQALKEIGSHDGAVEDASLHLSEDLGAVVNDITNTLAQRLDRPGGGGWTVQLQQEGAAEHGQYGGIVTVQLELHRWHTD